MAQPFQFRLQTLLRVRELREREAKRKLAAKRAEIARTDQLIRDTLAEIERQQAALRSLQSGTDLSPTDLTRTRAWINHLRRTLAQQQVQKASLLAELELRLDEYRQAHTQTQVLDKLRERKFVTWKRDRTLRQQSEQDELAQQMHAKLPIG